MANILGLHHVTAIAGDPQRNIDFYSGLLGLRLVKLTVNYDDPTAYHLYYGDGQGHPGTILTFFSWPGAINGRIGTGQVAVTLFAVPNDSLTYWKQRLTDRRITFHEAESEFGEQVISFADPDGTQIELVTTATADSDRYWAGGGLPGEVAIHGLHHVTLWEEGYERTAELLTDTLGFRLIHEQRNRFRYAVGSGNRAHWSIFFACRRPSLAGSQLGLYTTWPGVHRQIMSKPHGGKHSVSCITMFRPSWTGLTFIRSTFASREVCCLRLQLIRQVSVSTSIRMN